MLCVLAVFIPSFFMEGAARELFVPLSLAVGFAMVDVLSPVQHLRAGAVGLAAAALSSADPGRCRSLRIRPVSGRLCPRRCEPSCRCRWAAGRQLTSAAVGLVIWLVGGQLGTEIFPTVDAGQFQLRLRAPDGTRIERTEEIAKQALEIIKEEAGQDNDGQDSISLGYVGLIGSSYPINNIFLWTRGPEEAVLRVALKPGSGVRVEDLKHRLRDELPRRLGDWLAQKLRAEGLADGQGGRARAGPCSSRSSRPTSSTRS